MVTVNMLQAKTNLSKLVQAIEDGIEDEIVIARSGRPAVRIVPLARSNAASLIGIAEGAFQFEKDSFDQLDAEIAHLFDIPPVEELHQP